MLITPAWTADQIDEADRETDREADIVTMPIDEADEDADIVTMPIASTPKNTYTSGITNLEEWLNALNHNEASRQIFVDEIELTKDVTVKISRSGANVPHLRDAQQQYLSISVWVRGKQSQKLTQEAMRLVTDSSSWNEVMSELDQYCKMWLCPGRGGPMLESVIQYFKDHDQEQLEAVEYTTDRIFSKNCLLICGRRSGACGNCRNLSRKIDTLRKKMGTAPTPKKNTNTKYLTKSDLVKRNKDILEDFKRQKSKENAEMKRLKSQVSQLKNRKGPAPEEALDIVIDEISKNDPSLDLDFVKLYFTTAIANSRKSKKSAYRYSDELWEYIISLYSEGTSRYVKLRETCLPLLPSPQAVRKRIGSALEPREKLDQRQIDRLVKQIMHNSGNQFTKALICVAIDEMSIERGIVRMNGRTIGYLPGTQTEFSGDELSGVLRLATHITAVFVSSIDSKLRYPLFILPTTGSISGNEMLRLFQETVAALTNVGLRVVSTTSDSGDGERKLQQMLGVCAERPFFPNPITGDRIFFLADPPHVLKRFRNTIYNNSRTIIMPGGGTVRWGLLRMLYEEGLTDGLKKIRKLVKAAVIHDRFSKMRVKWAAIVCDPEVTTALKNLNSKDAVATALYFEIMYGWWRYINSKTVINRDNKDAIIRRLDETLCWYIDWMENDSIKDDNKITPELFADIKMTIQSFKEVINIAAGLSDEFELWPRRLNQDCVESFFSQLRSGSNSSPTLHETANKLHAIRLTGAVRVTQKKNQNTIAESATLCSMIERNKSPARNAIFTPAKILKATDDLNINRRKSVEIKRRRLFNKKTKDQEQKTEPETEPETDATKFDYIVDFPMKEIRLDHTHGIGVVTEVIRELRAKTFSLTKTETMLSKFTRELVLSRLDEVNIELLGTMLVDTLNYTRDCLTKFGVNLQYFEFDPNFGVPKDITILSAPQVRALAPHFEISIVDRNGHTKSKLELCEAISDALDRNDTPRPNILTNSKSLEDQLIGIVYDEKFSSRLIKTLETADGGTERCQFHVMYMLVIQCTSMMLRTLALFVRRVLHNSIEELFKSSDLSSEQMTKVAKVDTLDHLYRYSGFIIHSTKSLLDKTQIFSTEKEKNLLREALPIHTISVEPPPHHIIFDPRKYHFPQGIDFTNCPNQITLGGELDAISRGGLIWVSEDFFAFVVVVEYITTIALRFLFSVTADDEEFLVTLAVQQSQAWFSNLYQRIEDKEFKEKLHRQFCRLVVVTLAREHHASSTERMKGIARDDRTRARKKKLRTRRRRNAKARF